MRQVTRRTLATVSLAVILGFWSPAQAEPPRQFSPGEIWGTRTVIFGQPVVQVTRVEPKGRMTSVTESGGIRTQSSGRYTYANGILSVRYDNGHFEKDAVIWLDKDHTKVTCIESSIPGAIGMQLVSTRLNRAGTPGRMNGNIKPPVFQPTPFILQPTFGDWGALQRQQAEYLRTMEVLQRQQEAYLQVSEAVRRMHEANLRNAARWMDTFGYSPGLK